MLNINERFVQEAYDEQNRLTSFRVTYPQDFNYAVQVLDAIAGEEPDKICMQWCNPEGERHSFTFGQMSLWSSKTAAYLQSLGIGKGDAVIVVLRRHYQFWFAAMALAKLGALLIPATFMLKEHDLSYRLEASHAKAIIATNVGDFADVVDAVLDGDDSVLRILVNGAGGGTLVDAEGNLPDSLRETCGETLSGDAGICAADAQRKGWYDFNAGVREASSNFVAPAYDVYDPMIMYFSSGTTGNPKMVLHNSTYALAHLLTGKHWHCVNPAGLHLTIADTGWGKAVWGKLYGQWLMEAAVMVYDFDRFNAAEILRIIGDYRVTSLCCPPTMYRMLIAEDLSVYDLSSLEYCTTAGEALNPDLFDFWKEHTGFEIHEGYGQTETPLTIANLRGEALKPGSMGKPVPQYHVCILREDGSECTMGETGEICIDVSDNPAGIMVEYYENPEKTREAKHDGWYHTGDTAWKDEDGYFWYVGRNDDVIKSSGYRIGPFEIESVLLEHSAVKECAVTGVPDELRGMAVKATIVLNPPFTPSDDLIKELQTWVKRRTAPYKYPRVVDFVDELPKTVNGKIMRTVIRDRDCKGQ